MDRSNTTRTTPSPVDNDQDLVVVDLDGEMVVLDRRHARAAHLDARTAAQLRSDDHTTRQAVLDALGDLGLGTCSDERSMSRRRLLAAGTVAGITVLALPTAAAALSTTTTSSITTTTSSTTTTIGPPAPLTLTKSNPVVLTLSPDGTKIYVPLYTGGVDIVDTATDTVTNLANSAAPKNSQVSGCWAAVPSFDATRVYVTNNTGTYTGSVKVLNASTGALVTTIAVGPAPTAAVLDSTGTRLYVLNGSSTFGGNSVSVVDTDSSSGTLHTVFATITGLNRP